jgi:hypothetical protein
MNEEAAGVEGTSPARAREAACELVRRTGPITRGKCPDEEKICVLLKGTRGQEAVSEPC